MSKTKRYYGIKPELRTVLLDYLGKRPHNEVADMVVVLQTAVPLEITTEEEPPVPKKKK